MMGRVITLAAMVAALIFTASAWASSAPPRNVSGSALVHAGLQSPACPAGVPTQTLTVVDQAQVAPSVLGRVTHAISAQSMQLRAAWGTPCVTFGPGGWRVYLKIGLQAHGVHLWHGAPYAIVWTGVGTVESWSRDFSHEILEMLVDPETNRSVFVDGVGRMVEVADPVEWYGYRLDGVYVSDFVLPTWFAGATTGEPTCVGDSCSFPGPPLASADAAGPYDQMRLLTAPWQGPASP
jgi:hypothetical protein